MIVDRIERDEIIALMLRECYGAMWNDPQVFLMQNASHVGMRGGDYINARLVEADDQIIADWRLVDPVTELRMPIRPKVTICSSEPLNALGPARPRDATYVLQSCAMRLVLHGRLSYDLGITAITALTYKRRF